MPHSPLLLILTKHFIWFKSVIVPVTWFNNGFNTSEKIKDKGRIILFLQIKVFNATAWYKKRGIYTKAHLITDQFCKW